MVLGFVVCEVVCVVVAMVVATVVSVEVMSLWYYYGCVSFRSYIRVRWGYCCCWCCGCGC